MPPPPPLALDALRTTLLQDDWFRSCPVPLQDALLALGRSRLLADGEPLFVQGQTEGGLYCVLQGAVTVQSAALDGHMPVLVVAEATHWFGELSFTDGQPRSHDAVADGPTTVWCLDRQPLHAWLDQHPIHWKDIARLAVGKLRITFQVFDAEMRGPMTQRVARRLWLAARGWGWRPGSPLRRLRCSQDQLARMLGSSRTSISKALHELVDGGAIRLHYGSVEVLDIGTLRRACDPPV
jgi:CRP-like cAMP-binding protein